MYHAKHDNIVLEQARRAFSPLLLHVRQRHQSLLAFGRYNGHGVAERLQVFDHSRSHKPQTYESNRRFFSVRHIAGS